MTKLVADAGYVYTNGETSGATVYLGKADSPENWWMIPEIKAEATTETEEKAKAYDVLMGVSE